MTRLILSILLSLTVLIVNAQVYQETNTVEEQLEDFEIFKNTVKRHHSGAYVYNDATSLNASFKILEATMSQKPLSKLEQLGAYSKFISSIKCIHSKAYYNKLTPKKLRAKYLLPFDLYFINNKLLAKEDYQLNKVAIAKEDQIITINDEDVDAIKQDLHTYISSDGNSIGFKDYMLKKLFLYYYFIHKHGEPSSLKLRYIHKGDTVTNTFSLEEKKGKNESKEIKLGLKIDTIKNFAHFTLPYPLPGGKKYEKKLKEAFSRIRANKIDNLIVDLQNNHGGKDQNYFAGYFIDSLIPYDYMQFRPFHRSAYKKHFKGKFSLQYLVSNLLGRNANGKTVFLEPNIYQYTGKVFVLINEGTASAASNLASTLKEWTDATIVGKESGGGYKSGNTGGFVLELPNSEIRVTIRTIKYANTIKSVYQENGVTPHYKVEVPTKVDEESNSQLNYVLEKLLKVHE